MRFLVLATLLLPGCPSSQLADIAPTSFDGDAGAGSAPRSPCFGDDDCALAGASCCACPSFAVAANDPGLKSCGTINCPPMPADSCPNNLRAACVGGSCALACRPMACGTTCAGGFASDANGCLLCECLQPGPDACVQDGDCVEVKADCCGCAHGGADTAVLAAQASAYEASLGCPSSPQCPNQNVCSFGAVARCAAGQCTLEAPSALPPGACGRTDLPACPAGQVCTVNASPDADRQGVGVCAPPPS